MANSKHTRRFLSLLLLVCMALALLQTGAAMAEGMPDEPPSGESTAAPASEEPEESAVPVPEAAGAAAAASDGASGGQAAEGFDGTEGAPEQEEQPEELPERSDHGPYRFEAASASGVSIYAEAPSDAFVGNVTMTVRDVRLDSRTEAQVLNTVDGRRVLAAVDITFRDEAGSQVEPLCDVTFTLRSEALLLADELEVVHVDTLEDGAVDPGSAPQKLASSSTADDAVLVQTDSFSIFAVVDADSEDLPAVLTVTFVDGEGREISVQAVKEGETLYEPEVPRELANRRFVGWYAEGSEDPYRDFGAVGPVAENTSLRLTARYSDATANIIYHDTQGNVVQTDAVPVNTRASVLPESPMIATDSLTLCHYGWATSPGGKTDVSGSLPVGTKDIDLYPIVLEGCWVNFDSDGGTAVKSRFIPATAAGDERKVKQPADPYREGYRFDGWYNSSDRTDPYDFDVPVSAPHTIYARWTPKDNTQYKVLYWIEYQSDIKNDLWDYKLLARIVKESTTGAEAVYDPDLIFNHPYQHKEYGYVLNTEKSETKTVAPDGSTVVNVYYDCQKRSLSFIFPDRDGQQVTVSASDIKFSADMGFFWDMVAEHNDLDYLLDGHHEFLLSPHAISIDTKSDLTKLSTWEDEVGYWRYAYYNLADRTFYETLEGVAPEGKEVVRNTSYRMTGDTTDDRTYYEVSRSYVYGGWNKGVVPGTPTGFRCYFKGSDGNYGWSASNLRTIWYHRGNGYGLNDSRDPEMRYEYNEDPDGFMDIYFIRQKYELNFHENGGADLENQEVYYQKNISVFDPAVTDPAHYTPGVSMRTNPDGQLLTFAGWYTDVMLSEPFDGFDQTMPALNIDLYAKWAPITYTVSFDTNGGSEIPPITGVEYSQRVIKPADPTREHFTFLGWTLNGEIFSFESGITEDITLVAQWKSVNVYPVIYDLNGGSGTVPKDGKTYYADAKVIALPPADDVTGPGGKVFLGWLADSDGKLYYPNGSVSMPTAPLTLTAQWGELPLTTSFLYDFNYGSYGITSTHTSAAQHAIDGLQNNTEITAADFSDFGEAPDGYTFLGWNTSADGKGRMIRPGDRLWLDREEPLPNRVFAIWEKTAAPTPTPAPGRSPRTGDTDRPQLFLGLMLLSASAGLWIYAKARRKGAQAR